MEERAAFEERGFSGWWGDGEGLEGGRRVAIIFQKMQDPLAVGENKSDRLFLILEETCKGRVARVLALHSLDQRSLPV